MKNNNYKILQIVDSLQIGGSERMSVNMYNTFTSQNIENCLVVSRKSGPLINFVKDKGQVYFLNKKGFFDCFAFYRLFKLVKKQKPSIIHAHQTSIYWTFLIKLFFSRIIVIWHDHWGFSDLLKDSDRKIVKYFSFLIDGVVCVNEKLKEWNSRNLKVKNESIVFIRNYAALEVVKSKNSDKFILVCVANIRDQKDHPNLLEACSILKEQNIKFELLLAGSLSDVNYVEKVKTLIKTLKLDKEVTILGPITNISEVLSKADVGILSSVSEGLPVSLLEYGLAELPVVCTDVGQCKEVLGNGKFGWIVPSKSPKELANAIKEAVQNQELSNSKAVGLSKGFLLKYLELINIIENN